MDENNNLLLSDNSLYVYEDLIYNINSEETIFQPYESYENNGSYQNYDEISKNQPSYQINIVDSIDSNVTTVEDVGFCLKNREIIEYNDVTNNSDDLLLPIDEESPRINHPPHIKIVLKHHQLAMVHKCLQIEKFSIIPYGIMNDKPGTGKTYAILTLLYVSQKKGNIIVVPQNIISQWIQSIEDFSEGEHKLNYKCFTEYNDILQLYSGDCNLFDYDILLTTSLYYNMISTTMTSNYQMIERIFFDEIDSISSLVRNKIDANFIWFISATFQKNLVGFYTELIDPTLLPYITCNCKEEFIQSSFLIEEPNIYKIICKNLYIDRIFCDIFSNDEFELLNAHDYTKLKRKFYNKIAQNENDALDLIIKDQIEIIDTETIRLEDLEKILPTKTDKKAITIINEQIEKTTELLKMSKHKLSLIKERLKDNNCCPTCYNEYESNQKKVLSKCCKNIICYDCADNWFHKMMKNSCIYCNVNDIKMSDYVIIKQNDDNICQLCDYKYVDEDEEYYSFCCKKKCCYTCLKEWYTKLLKTCCIYCNRKDILIEDFATTKQHQEIEINLKSCVKNTKKTKLQFIEYFIQTKIYNYCKVIFCSTYTNIFNTIRKLFQKYKINFLELDDGNIESINKSLYSYHYGNNNILLLNSNFFGCGLNLQCTTDIIFLHKTDENLEKQIIGRAQRPGRTSKLNIWYLFHKNELLNKHPGKFEIDSI